MSDDTPTTLRTRARHALHLDNPHGLSAEELSARRRARMDMVIGLCWGLIVLKTFAVVWIVNHYNMPFNPMWVVAPTVSMAFVATSLYYWIRD